jgi:uncharacterized hydrophobic protein (TIGR00271 family)
MILRRIREILKRLTGGWGIYREELIPADELSFRMRSNAIPAVGFFLMLALSGTIATLGLIANSAPAIIGAMIIAPLMAPIISLAYAVASVDRGLAVLSTLTVAAGAATTIGIAYIGVEIIGARIAGSEVLARASPSLIDLGVALAAGCAGAVAQTRLSIANSIAGVAIAVALVPPLAVTGIGLSLGHKAASETGVSLSKFGLASGGFDIASGAFLLFLTNLIGIVVIAALVFIVQRYGDWKKGLIVIALVVIGSFGLMPTLNQALYEIIVKNRVVRLQMKYASQARESDLYAGAVQFRQISAGYREGLLHVSIELLVSRDRLNEAQKRVDAFRERLARDLGEPVALEVDVVPIDVIRFSSRPKS